MTQCRRYRALYDFVARDSTELSMKTGDLLLVKQQPGGTWPSAEKWMLGINETTSKHGDFPGGDYVEFVQECTLPNLKTKPKRKPKPMPKPVIARRRTTCLDLRESDSHSDSKSELQSYPFNNPDSHNTGVPQPQLTHRPQRLATDESEKTSVSQDAVRTKNATLPTLSRNPEKHMTKEDESQAQTTEAYENLEFTNVKNGATGIIQSIEADAEAYENLEFTNVKNGATGTIQSIEAEGKKFQEETQAQIRELTNTLRIKEGVIRSTEAKLEEEKRKSSQLQRELNDSLRAKEAAIQSAKDVQDEMRISFQQQREVKAELTTLLRVKEDIIKARNDEVQAKVFEIQMKSKQIAKLQQKVKEGEETSSNISKKTWNIPRAQIQGISKQEIGHGAWGVVYSGTFQQEPVAIKYAHKDLLHTTTIEMLKREVMIMVNIQHPNLVRFVGAVFDNAVERGRDMPIILSELMDMNLRTAYKKKNLSSSLISIFRDVAYALHYLHQHRHPIIHRDVSAPNVLLKSLRSGDYQAKVSDFGSANLVKQSTTAGAGAIVYCAPEMFPNEDITAPPQPQTTKVDVFSYGILLLEVIVREIPNPATRYTMLQQVKDKCQQELVVQCTKPLPSDRPAMTDILDSLHKMH